MNIVPIEDLLDYSEIYFFMCSGAAKAYHKARKYEMANRYTYKMARLVRFQTAARRILRKAHAL